jgi:carotenoid 1,2-hydratase
MRAADLWRAGAVRPAYSASAGGRTGDDTGRFQPAVSGDGGRVVRPQLARMDGVIPASGCANQASGIVSGGGQHPSGTGRADGGAVRPLGGRLPDGGPRFDQAVVNDGYAWWYVDALSDDGESGLTIIAFIGSVFSPYYAFARRKGPADPLNHCAINVAIYRKRGSRWAMTERPRRAVSRTAASLAVGPSSLAWDGNSLTIRLDEIAVPIPGRIRGTVRVVPAAVTRQAFTLNENGSHLWWPIAPCARVQVALDHPHLRWQGDGYFDMNRGDAPLEQGFADWQWARGVTPDGASIILYEAQRRGGGRVNLAMTFDPDGRMRPFEPPPAVDLRPTGWRIGRKVRSENTARIVRTLEDAPFYARSLVLAEWLGRPVILMHESLSLDRFGMPVVQAMLPFRMPRSWR